MGYCRYADVTISRYTLNLNLCRIILIYNDLILSYLFCTHRCTHLEQGVC